MSSKIDNIIHRNFLNKNQKIENVHTYINKIQYLQSSDLQIKSDNASSAQTHVFGEQWLSPKVIIYKSRLKLLFFLLPFIFLRHNGSCEVHTFMERRRGCNRKVTHILYLAVYSFVLLTIIFYTDVFIFF